MEPRKSFSFFRSYYDAAKRIPDTDDRCSYLMGLCEYALYGTAPEMTATASALFELAKPNIDASRKRADGRQRANNGKQMSDNGQTMSDNGQTMSDNGRQMSDNGQTMSEICVPGVGVGVRVRDRSMNIPPQPPKGVLSETQERLFEQFWAVYPRKRAKGEAKKAWAKLNPSDKIFKAIMESLPVLSASPDWTKDGGQFIPYPATWLNREGWNDEVKVSSSPQSDHARKSAEWMKQVLEGE